MLVKAEILSELQGEHKPTLSSKGSVKEGFRLQCEIQQRGCLRESELGLSGHHKCFIANIGLNFATLLLWPWW